jgi:hypothetical protein
MSGESTERNGTRTISQEETAVGECGYGLQLDILANKPAAEDTRDLEF